MSRSTKLVAVKRGSLILAALAVVLGGGALVQTIVRLDPFRTLKKVSKEIDPNLGLRMEGVNIKGYDKEKLTTQAQIDRMDVPQDKQRYDLFGVHDGTFFGQQGAMSFDAPRAEWNVPGHQLEAPFGGHVKDKNVDLNVPPFAFKSDTGLIHIPGQVDGKLYGGLVKARAVQYDINKGVTTAGHIAWQGNLSGDANQGDQSKPRVWQIEGGPYDRHGDIESYDNATAFDGDIWVLADHVDHDRKTDIVVATGHVKYFSVKTDMVCDKAVIERKIKKATLTGNVQMLLKAKDKQTVVSKEDVIPPYRPIVPEEIARTRPAAPPQGGQTAEQKRLDDEIRSGSNTRDFPTTCSAEKIVYWYKEGERHAEISGKPQARQEFSDGRWRQVWTNTAYYDGENETLKLGDSKDQYDTHMVNSIGDDMQTTWIIVSTKDGDEDMHGGKAKGHMVDQSDEIPKADKAKPVNQGSKTGATGGGTGTTGGAGTSGGSGKGGGKT